MKALPSVHFDVGAFCKKAGADFNAFCWEFICSYFLSAYDRANKQWRDLKGSPAARYPHLVRALPSLSLDLGSPRGGLRQACATAEARQHGDVFSAGVMCDGGAHHPSPPTSGASAGAVNPHVATAHTGAGFYIIDKHGWLAGAGAGNIWQSFGGRRKHSESPWQTASREMLEETGIASDDLVSLAPPVLCAQGRSRVRAPHRDLSFNLRRLTDAVS